MTTTRLRRVARLADVTDQRILDAFAEMPHHAAVPGRDSYPVTYPAIEHLQREAHTTEWDPLSTEGPNRSTWRLTGYELIGEVPGRTMYVWRVQVNEGREEFVAVQYGRRGLEVCHAHDYQPASERTRTAATEKAHALLAAKVADDAAGPCAQCSGPQSSGRHTTDPHRDGHPFVPDVVEDSAELADDLAAELQADARAAHARGMVAAPALSAVVMREAEGLPVGSARFTKVATVWADAYQAAVDAEVAHLFPNLVNPPADPSPEYAHRGDDALRIMGARGDDDALIELDRRRAAERAAWDRQYARGNKPAEPTGPIPGSFHDPRVECCQRDAADCDCPEPRTCERCGGRFTEDDAGADPYAGLCPSCTARNADRVAL